MTSLGRARASALVEPGAESGVRGLIGFCSNAQVSSDPCDLYGQLSEAKLSHHGGGNTQCHLRDFFAGQLAGHVEGGLFVTHNQRNSNPARFGQLLNPHLFFHCGRFSTFSAGSVGDVDRRASGGVDYALDPAPRLREDVGPWTTSLLASALFRSTVT